MSSSRMLQIIPESVAREKGYIKLEDDYLDTTIEDAEFITLTPDTAKGGTWEKVTYYLSRVGFKSKMEEGRGQEWVYVLSNPLYSGGVLKIGFTSSTPELRKQTIDSSTGVPLPFTVEYAKQCINGRQLEQAVHRYFSRERVNPTKEFFQVPLQKAIEVIEQIHDQLESQYTKTE